MNRSGRNLWIRLSIRPFLMQGRRRRQVRKGWFGNHYYLSFSLLSASSSCVIHGHVSQISMLAFRTFLYDNLDNRVERPQVRATHVSLYLAFMWVSAVCECSLTAGLKRTIRFLFFFVVFKNLSVFLNRSQSETYKVAFSLSLCSLKVSLALLHWMVCLK